MDPSPFPFLIRFPFIRAEVLTGTCLTAVLSCQQRADTAPELTYL